MLDGYLFSCFAFFLSNYRKQKLIAMNLVSSLFVPLLPLALLLWKKGAKLLHSMLVLAGTKEEIPKFFLEIGKLSREINNSVSWWYWLLKERRIGEMHQMHLP